MVKLEIKRKTRKTERIVKGSLVIAIIHKVVEDFKL
jgi:hypothetical protein